MIYYLKYFRTQILKSVQKISTSKTYNTLKKRHQLC